MYHKNSKTSSIGFRLYLQISINRRTPDLPQNYTIEKGLTFHCRVSFSHTYKQSPRPGIYFYIYFQLVFEKTHTNDKALTS